MVRLLAVACFVSVVAQVEPAAPGPGVAPRFDDYPAAEPVYRGPKARLKLRRGTDAWHFRTAIREGYDKTPVNFAGHCVAVEWGCGAPCQQWAIVDARSGSVHLVPFSTAGGAEYRVNSALFVADPPQCKADDCEGTAALKALYRGDHSAYYRWNGHAFEKIYSAEKSPPLKNAPSNKPLQPARQTAPRG